jgi:hypothetical protein
MREKRSNFVVRTHHPHAWHLHGFIGRRRRYHALADVTAVSRSAVISEA